MSNLGNAQNLATFTRKKSVPIYLTVKPGDVFDHWTILKDTGQTCSSGKIYQAVCDCGTVSTVTHNSLKYNQTHKCELCAIKERRLKRREKNKTLKGFL